MSDKIKNILIADDDDGVVKLFSMLLEDSGSNIYYCSKPEEAIDLIKKNEFDRVIVDYRFPNSKMSGSDILEEAERRGVEDRILITSVSLISSLEGTHAVLGARKPLTKRALMDLCYKDVDKIRLHSLIQTELTSSAVI